MRTLTPADRKQIVSHFQSLEPTWQHQPFYLFERIPQRKFQNASRSYAQNIPVGDEVIMLSDRTFFGSARRGFILTANRLYSRNHFNIVSIIDIDDIGEISVDSVNIGSGQSTPVMVPEVIIETPFVITRLQLWQGPMAKKFFISFKQTLKFLKTCSTEGTEPTLTHCVNCGATGYTGAKCRYCRAIISNS